MNVRVQTARGQNQTLARDDLSRDPYDHVFGHTSHYIGIARLADSCDETVFDADIGFVNSGPIHHQSVGDDAIERVFVTHARGLAHAFTDDLTTPEFAFVAVNREILFDLKDERRVAKANLVT